MSKPKTYQLEQKLQEIIAKSERFKDMDPRYLTRTFSNLRTLPKFPYKLIKLIGKEILFELWRHTIGKDKLLIKPVFMIGVPHSGTSISMKLFSRHPDIVNVSEKNTYWQPKNYLNPWTDHEKTEVDATDSEKTRLHARFEFRRWLSQKSRLLNKDPNNTVRIRFIREIFPDAFIIHIIRDGRAVVNSLIRSLPNDWEIKDRFKPANQRTNPWPGVKPPSWRSLLRDDPFEQHALQWRESIQYVWKNMDQKQFYREIKYEELCNDPKSILANAWEFADLKVSQKILDKLPKKLESRNYKWQKNFTRDQANRVTAIQKDLLKELGYL